MPFADIDFTTWGMAGPTWSMVALASGAVADPDAALAQTRLFMDNARSRLRDQWNLAGLYSGASWEKYTLNDDGAPWCTNHYGMYVSMRTSLRTKNPAPKKQTLTLTLHPPNPTKTGRCGSASATRPLARPRANERNELPLARTGAYLSFARSSLTPLAALPPPSLLQLRGALWTVGTAGEPPRGHTLLQKRVRAAVHGAAAPRGHHRRGEQGWGQHHRIAGLWRAEFARKRACGGWGALPHCCKPVERGERVVDARALATTRKQCGASETQFFFFDIT
jgi:hypothetical protein